MACVWITLQCHHGDCKWVWTGYSAAAKSAWAAHATIRHSLPVRASCQTCDPDKFELCASCDGGGQPPVVAVRPFSVTTFEASLLAALLEKAVGARTGKQIRVERAPGRRGGYDGSFLSQGVVVQTSVPQLTSLLHLVAPAPPWVLRIVLAAAPMGTAISPLLGWHAATATALRTGRFSPGGGRCVLSLRAACEVGTVEPLAVLSAIKAWPSQYVSCAVAACCRKRHGLASALATLQSQSKASVVATLLADNAPQDAISAAIGAGFAVEPAALTLALRHRPIDHATLAMLLAAAPTAVTDAVLAAATQAAAYDPTGIKALESVLQICTLPGSLTGELAMRCAIMTGNAAAWNALWTAGARLPCVFDSPCIAVGVEALVYATCRMRGQERRNILSMMVGKCNRDTEIALRSKTWDKTSPQLELAEWACEMLSEADIDGTKDFVRWVAPLLDDQPSWTESVYKVGRKFAGRARVEEYLAIRSAYGCSINPDPMSAMMGMCDADAEVAIQWLIDCRPHVLSASQLVEFAQWSPTAALACNVSGVKFARRPAWWCTLSTTLVLCCAKMELAPLEISRHICSFIISAAKSAPNV